MTAFVGNTNVLELTGLQNALTAAYINDATVTVTVKDAAGTAVSGETWPLAMSYVAASNGDYRAVLVNGLALLAGRKYVAHIDADGGADLDGNWQLPFWPQTRVD